MIPELNVLSDSDISERTSCLVENTYYVRFHRPTRSPAEAYISSLSGIAERRPIPKESAPFELKSGSAVSGAWLVQEWLACGVVRESKRHEPTAAA